MSQFTPGSALAGGALIGAAAVLLLCLVGRIAGISGILERALVGPERAWRWAFLLGLVVGAGTFLLLGGQIPPARTALPAWLLALAGGLVGYGAALGSGCTSGHGVCGIARLSKRSFAATATFLLVAFATTYVVRHVFKVAS